MTTTSIGPQHSRHVFANGSEAPWLLHDQWQAKSAERRIGIREHRVVGSPLRILAEQLVTQPFS